MDTIAPGARMGHRVTIRKVSHARYSWRATFVEGGKWKQKYFKTKAKAEEWKEEREEEALTHGTDSAITAAERATVVETRAELENAGLSLREAITMAVSIREKEARSCTVAELIERSITSRKNAGLSDSHIEDLESRLGKFEKAFGEQAVATVTKDEIEEWLKNLSVANATKNHYRTLLISIFNDAVDDEFTDKNTAAKTRKFKVTETEVEILTAEQAASLITGASNAILPALAIGLFAGLRDSELQRLNWKEVNLEMNRIRVSAKKTKSARNRTVIISKNLKAWLQPFAQKSGKVWPSNGRKLMEAARLAAGFAAPAKVAAAKEQGTELLEWPANSMRHSFGTYHLLHHKDAGALALEMGHTDTKVIFNHYRDANATVEQAATYWSIIPNSAQNVVEMPEAS